FGRDFRHVVVSAFEPSVFDRDVLPFDESGVTQTFSEGSEIERGIVERAEADVSDRRLHLLLRTRRERPRRRRAAEPRDELAPFHSITSSARASSVGGTARPSAFAVLRLKANLNRVGCSNGRSAGFAPLRIRSTRAATRPIPSSRSTE